MRLHPYLIFPGTCREALDFYAAAFGGTIEHLQTVGESPLPAGPEHADRIFNALFTAGALRFGASDGEPGNDPTVGTNFAMFVSVVDEREHERVFRALAEGGRVLFPRADGFGMVEDRFGIRWMLALAPASDDGDD